MSRTRPPARVLAVLGALAILMAIVASRPSASIDVEAADVRGDLPPPGGLTVGVAAIADPKLIALVMPFAVESISAFDVATQSYLVYIPGAPHRVNTLTAESLTPGTVVLIKRRDDGNGRAPGVFARSTQAIGAADLPVEGTPAIFPEPVAGGMTLGVAGTNSPRDLVAAQPFDVQSMAAFDVRTQSFLVFIPSAPDHVSTLNRKTLRPDTVVWMLRSEPETSAGTPGPSAPDAAVPDGADSLSFAPVAPAAPAAAPSAAPAPTSSSAPAPAATPAPSTTPSKPKATPSSNPTPAKAGSSGGCEPVPADRLSLLSQAVGFGRNTTGGAAGCLYVVTNGNDSGPGSLRAGAEAGDRWIVFDGDFTISLNSHIHVNSNTTIDGRGRRVQISGAGLYLVHESNFIVENVTLRHGAADANTDLIRVNWGSDFWIDHVTFHDTRDEYIDITRAASSGTRGTISWSRFERGGRLNTNEFAVLIGDQGAIPTNHLLQVTLHHNYFDYTRQRHPLMTGATVHSFNNFIGYRLAGFEVRCLGGSPCAQLVSQNDVIDVDNGDNANRATWVTDGGNSIRIENPELRNGAIVKEVDPAGAFNPADRYPYSLSPTDGLADLLRGAAGAH